MQWSVVEKNIPNTFFLYMRSFFSILPFVKSVPPYHWEMREFINQHKSHARVADFPIENIPELMRIFYKHDQFQKAQLTIVKSIHISDLEPDHKCKLYDEMQSNNPVFKTLFTKILKSDKEGYIHYLLEKLWNSDLTDKLSLVKDDRKKYSLKDRIDLVVALNHHKKCVSDITAIVTKQEVNTYILNNGIHWPFNELLKSKQLPWGPFLLKDAYVAYFVSKNDSNVLLDTYFNLLVRKSASHELIHLLKNILSSIDSNKDDLRRHMLEKFFAKISNFDLCRTLLLNLMQYGENPVVSKSVIDILQNKIDTFMPFKNSQWCYLVSCEYADRFAKDYIGNVAYEDYKDRHNDLTLDMKTKNLWIPLKQHQHEKIMDMAISHRLTWVTQQIKSLKIGIQKVCQSLLTGWKQFFSTPEVHREQNVTEVLDVVPKEVDAVNPSIRKEMQDVQMLYQYRAESQRTKVNSQKMLQTNFSKPQDVLTQGFEASLRTQFNFSQ